MANDVQFFFEHPRRQARIRLPRPGEFLTEFRSLGMHHENRRRVLVWNCRSPRLPNGMMLVPFLKFADEDIADDDKTVLALLKELMDAEIASQRHG